MHGLWTSTPTGGAAGGDPGGRPRSDAVTTPITAATASTTATTTPTTAITTDGRTGTEGLPSRRTRARGTRERHGPGGPGERAPDLHAGRSAAGTASVAGGAAAPYAGSRPPAGPGPPTRPRPGLRGIRRRFRARLGFVRSGSDHGRLRAERRGGHRRRLVLPLRPRPPHPLSTRLAAVRPLLGHGVPRQPGLGVVRGGPGTARAQSQLRRPVLPVLRSARDRGAARARQAAGDQGRLGLPRAGRLADRRLAAHPGVEPRPRAGREVGRARAWRTQRCRWPTRCSTSRWSAWCSRCTSGGRR